MQYLLTEDEYTKYELLTLFGPKRDLCEDCKRDSGEDGVTACHKRYALADVAIAYGMQFTVTSCKDYVPEEERSEEGTGTVEA